MENEELAQKLAKKTERAVKILKILVCIAMVLFAVTAVFGVIALTVIGDKQTAVIGIAVLMGCLAALAVCIMTTLAYAYITLNKLKKLK